MVSPEDSACVDRLGCGVGLTSGAGLVLGLGLGVGLAAWRVRVIATSANIKLANSNLIVCVDFMEDPFLEGEGFESDCPARMPDVQAELQGIFCSSARNGSVIHG